MSNIKLSLYVPFEEPEPHLSFASQIGADRVYTWIPENLTDVAGITAFRTRVGDAGLTLHNVGCIAHGKDPSIHLGLSDRDERINAFCEFVSNLGRAGVSITTFTWEPDQVWSSERGTSRGASARSVAEGELLKIGLKHGRKYTRTELWDNFAYFIERMTPVCEEAGVRLAMHPNDPPSLEELGGVPCLIHSMADYIRAFEHAPPNVLGMEFCCGCWLEGGDRFGDPAEAIRRFTREDRVLIVHFRNVTAALPDFTETFLDNGYGNMRSIIEALADEGYAGTVTPDHVPILVDPYGAGASMAYATGYIRALLQGV